MWLEGSRSRLVSAGEYARIINTLGVQKKRGRPSRAVDGMTQDFSASTCKNGSSAVCPIRVVQDVVL